VQIINFLSGRAKKAIKNNGLIFLYMKVTISGTHGSIFALLKTISQLRFVSDEIWQREDLKPS
jgi:hypothetical protein